MCLSIIIKKIYQILAVIASKVSWLIKDGPKNEGRAPAAGSSVTSYATSCGPLLALLVVRGRKRVIRGVC